MPARPTRNTTPQQIQLRQIIYAQHCTYIIVSSLLLKYKQKRRQSKLPPFSYSTLTHTLRLLIRALARLRLLSYTQEVCMLLQAPKTVPDVLCRPYSRDRRAITSIHGFTRQYRPILRDTRTTTGRRQFGPATAKGRL